MFSPPVSAKLGTALEALQLCLKLLPPSCREELRRLLTFMALAADPQGIKLDKEVRSGTRRAVYSNNCIIFGIKDLLLNLQMENRLAVKRSFSRAVLRSKDLSREKEDLMVVFMLSNIKEIFKVVKCF